MREEISDNVRREYPDDTPVEVPVEIQKPTPLRELIQMYVKQELGIREGEPGSLEDEDDFELEDEEPDWLSGYQILLMENENDESLDGNEGTDADVSGVRHSEGESEEGDRRPHVEDGGAGSSAEPSSNAAGGNQETAAGSGERGEGSEP